MNLPYSSYQFLWKVADWVYPPVCAGCGKANFRFCPDCLTETRLINHPQCPSCGQPLLRNEKICKNCRGKPTPFFSMIFSWAEYDGVLRKAIHAFKYKQDLGLADTFSVFLINLLIQKELKFDIIIPIPLSKHRFKTRGFNQSELLARPLSLYFGVPITNDSVIRIKDTSEQVNLSALERNINMEGAFFGNPAKLKGKNVLVVDDIITTGATMNHCANAILLAGAKSIYGISIAKTIKGHYSQGIARREII